MRVHPTNIGGIVYGYFDGQLDELCVYDGVLSAGEISALASPPVQLMAHWKFDEGAGAVASDSTGNGNISTLQNRATWVAGVVGSGALSFDGVDDQVSVASTSSITSIVDNFTVSFWAKPRSPHEIDPEGYQYGGVSGQRYAVAPVWCVPGEAGAGVSVGTNGVSVYEHSSDYLPAVAVYQAALTGWTHIALVYENKQPKIYVNGQLVRTGAVSARSAIRINPYTIGGMAYGHFDGQLDDLRIYRGVLSEIEIKALGDTQAASAQPYMPPHSLALSGTDAYANVPYSSSLNITGPITIEAWIKRNPDDYQPIVERYGANDGGYAVRLESDKLCFYTLHNSNDFDRLVSNSVLTSGVLAPRGRRLRR